MSFANHHRSRWISPRRARKALETGRGRGIKIAVIDSGIELSHPALHHIRLVDDIVINAPWPEASLVITCSAGQGEDYSGHGTAVAAVIQKCAPEAQIGSFRVLDENNQCKSGKILAAAILAIERGYHILNCSFGAKVTQKGLEGFKPWIDAAYYHGVHVVSACGNGTIPVPELPAHFPSVVAVNMVSTAQETLFFQWSNKQHLKEINLVEFSARGVDLELPGKNGTMVKRSGSSFAAPHVAGLLARLLSVYPELKPPVAKALLQEIATPSELLDAFGGE